MEAQTILAVVPKDLQLIWRLRRVVEFCCGQLRIARGSQEAVLYLRGVGVYGDRVHYPFPSLILLDSGSLDVADLEVLSWVRDEARLLDLPVVWLCEEPADAHPFICTLDSSCWIVDRRSLEGLEEALTQFQPA